jgi:hypothetical protein
LLLQKFWLMFTTRTKNKNNDKIRLGKRNGFR